MERSKREIVNSHGFTLIELLVSLVILAFVMLALYFLFDQSKWLYLAGERRSSIQDNGRIALESMERELRMAGFGVPEGNCVTAGVTPATWTPVIFGAGSDYIWFRSDIDNNSTMLKLDAATGATSLTVEDAARVCPTAGSGYIVLERKLRRWQALTCTYVDSTTLTVDALSAGFNAAESEVFTPEHIFYRLETNKTSACPNPGCLMRAEIAGNTVLSDDSSVGAGDWASLATNISQFQIQAFHLDGTALDLSDPTNYPKIARLRIAIRTTDRSRGVGQTQDFNLSSEILLRNSRL